MKKPTVKKQGKPKLLKSQSFSCDCVARKNCDVLVVTDFEDKDVCFDVFRKKKCLGGVYLAKKKLQKLITLLIKINN